MSHLPCFDARTYFRVIVKTAVLASYVYVWAPIRNLLRGIRGRCHTTVLTYHRVNDGYHDDVTVGVQQFQQQLEILCKHYDVIDMPECLADRVAPRRRPRVAITFDDGYEDNHAAAEVLRRFELPCTFFVCTRIVGTEKAFPHDLKRLGETVPSLDWGQVEEMASWGFHFAPHTANHANLAGLSPENARAEITLSRDDLIERLGESDSVQWFAYPHGRPEDISDDIRDELSNLGIRYCFSAYGGVNFPGFDPLDILRQCINHGFSRLGFRAVVEGWKVRVPEREHEHAMEPTQRTS